MKSFYNVLTLVTLMFVSKNLDSQEVKSDSLKKLYIPSSIVLQFAGNIGMFSIGPSWTFFQRKLSVDYSIGFVPKFYAEEAIYITSGKMIYSPRIIFNFKMFDINPISLGVVYSHTFGSRFSRYQDLKKYPEGYYWWNTANRLGILYQIKLNTKLNGVYIKELSCYLEASFWDLDLNSYRKNSNYSKLSLWGITTLGFGVRTFF